MGVGLLGAPRIAFAQASAKIYRIGWLDHGGPPSGANRNAGDFQQGLRDAGYVEGKNLAIEYRYAGGNPERLAGLVAELVRLPVDVIVTCGEPAALAAMRATSPVPIVMTEIGMDPVKAGLVASLARPGGNVTGLVSLSNDLWQKRMALLKEFAPKALRVAVLWNPANPGNADCVAETRDENVGGFLGKAGDLASCSTPGHENYLRKSSEKSWFNVCLSALRHQGESSNSYT